MQKESAAKQTGRVCRMQLGQNASRGVLFFISSFLIFKCLLLILLLFFSLLPS